MYLIPATRADEDAEALADGWLAIEVLANHGAIRTQSVLEAERFIQRLVVPPRQAAVRT